MFYNYSISGSYVWQHSEVFNEKLADEVKECMGALASFADGDRPVALYLSRGPKAMVCMLALLELSIPFVNIDKAIPEERVLYMLKTLSVKFAIVDDSMLSKEVDNVNVDSLFEPKEEHNGVSVANASDCAYYLFTSGTTGNPKAVAVLREGLANFFDGINEIFRFDKGQRILNMTSYSFDIVFLETLYAFYNGLAVVLTDDTQIGNTKQIAQLITDDKVDVVQMTPSRLKMFRLVDPELKCMADLKYILVGGEAFPQDELNHLQQCVKARIFNMYGPTETTIWSTVSELTDKKAVDVGMPIVNTDIYILNDKNQLLEAGSEGEICIGGKGLARGYVNNPEATDKAFIFLEIDGIKKRVYKTGDLGKIGENGLIYCFGRIDTQIKYNGHRIELDDIDSNILQTGIVAQTATCFDKDRNDLVTFYVNPSEVDNDAIRKVLEKKLPDYMIPRRYIRLEELFYTVSGKLDRKRLLTMQEETVITVSKSETLTEKIDGILAKNAVLNVSGQTLLKDVIPDSIIFLQILVDIEEAFGFEFDVSDLEMEQYEKYDDLVKKVQENISNL